METRPASAQSMTIRRQPPQTMNTLHEVPGACVQKIKTPFHMKIDPGFSVDPSTIRRTKKSHFLITRPRRRCRRPRNTHILASFPRGETRGERQKSRKIVKIAITPPETSDIIFTQFSLPTSQNQLQADAGRHFGPRSSERHQFCCIEFAR